MAPETLDELRSFHRFLTDKLGAAGIGLSPEEALDEWRCSHPVLTDDEAAIQEALDDVAAGDRGMVFEDFDRELRQRHEFLERKS